MRAADLSLTVSQRRLPCVLDPALLLAHPLGPALALRIACVLEGWVTRSFWLAVDSSELVQRRQARLAAAGELGAARQIDGQALGGWIALRERTDAGSWPLRWIGDSLPESQVGHEAEPELVERYEALAASLGGRVFDDGCTGGAWLQGFDPVVSALDTLALSACLDGAPVLSPCPMQADGEPWGVQALRRSKVNATPLEPLPNDSLFASERTLVREALARAGLAVWAERLPRLAVLHVWAEAPQGDALLSLDSDAATDPWDSAQAWWYYL